MSVTSAPPCSGHAKPFDPRELHCAMHLVEAAEGQQCALFLDRGRRLQITVRGAPLRSPVCLSPVAAQNGMGSTRRAELIRALDWIITHGRLPHRVHRSEAGAYRLLFILVALDGVRDGMPLQETARILFGETRVHQNWPLGGRAMRAQIRRAAERGEWLSAGGYRTLLR